MLALFLLPENLDRLAPKFLALKPGTRIVLNTFLATGWEADETVQAEGDCETYCTAHLYYVPANVAGTWRLPQGELALQQRFQTLSGTKIYARTDQDGGNADTTGTAYVDGTARTYRDPDGAPLFRAGALAPQGDPELPRGHQGHSRRLRRTVPSGQR